MTIIYIFLTFLIETKTVLQIDTPVFVYFDQFLSDCTPNRWSKYFFAFMRQIFFFFYLFYFYFFSNEIEE